MSLCRTALRIAVVEALRGRTRAGDNVLDSRIGVLEPTEKGATTGQTSPFVAVYTAGSDAKDLELRSLFENGSLSLQIEFGVTAAMAAPDPDTGAAVLFADIPPTDAALEFMLDLVAREIALALSDPDARWAEVFRSLVHRIDRIEVDTIRNNEDGQRLAARQMRLTCMVADDPVPGEFEAAEGILGLFLAAAADGPVAVRRIAEAIAATIGPAGADWQVDQRRAGMSLDELLAMGRGPIPGSAGATPVFERGRTEIGGGA